MHPLYTHQAKQNKIAKKMLKNDNHIIYGAPTGYGKSVAMVSLIDGYVRKGKRCLILAPSITLVNQLYGGLVKYRPKVSRGNDKRGHDMNNPSVQITSLQTANSRLKSDPNFFGHIDYIFWDEVHVSGDMKSNKIGVQVKALVDRYWNDAKWLGFSATPMTARWKQLNGWDDITYMYTTKWLIANQFLSHFKYHGTEEALLKREDKVVSSTGDYKMDIASKALSKPSSIEAFMNSYRSYRGSDNKTLVFCATISHAKLLQKEVTGSKLIHSEMSENEQLEVLEWFENQTSATLFNVSILTTGFDDPTVNLIILARPIRTIRLAIQIWGRGLRYLQGKICHIVDLCDVYVDCGLPTDERRYTDKDNATIGDPIYRCCKICEGVELAGRWRYKRDLETITSICPIEGCETSEKQIPYIEGTAVVVEDSKALIKREAKLKKKREKAENKERKRLTKKMKKREKEYNKIEDYDTNSAKSEVINLIKNSSHFHNTKYAYYLVKDVLSNGYGGEMNDLLKRYKLGRISGNGALNEIIKWSKQDLFI